MRGVPLSVLMLVLGVTLSAALELHLEQQNVRECPGGFDAAAALDNATLYAQVYTWMHQRDVLDWKYNRTEMRTDPANGGQYSLPAFLTYYGEDEGQRRWTAIGNGTDCALVSYNTEVESPSVFARFMRNLHMFIHFPIAVHKFVCLDDETVVETAKITIPLIHEMSMTTRYAVEGSVVNTTVDASYIVPWYIDFLINDVSQHLLTNFKEKIDAVAQSLCVPMPPPLGLVSPQHMYLRKHPPHTHDPKHPPEHYTKDPEGHHTHPHDPHDPHTHRPPPRGYDHGHPNPRP